MTVYASGGPVATSGVLRPLRTRLSNVKITNNGGATAYLQFHNRTAVLAGGEVPMYWIPVGASGFASIEKIYFTLGCVLALSSTPTTYTAYANGWFYAEIED